MNRIMVIGAEQMGSGIAQVFAAAEYHVGLMILNKNLFKVELTILQSGCIIR